jgi:DNA-binding CsgD family transcriptional regulator
MSMAAIVNRDREQSIITSLLNGVRQRGAALVVSGDPGIGKSALVTEASRTAASMGMLPLATSGAQAEANLAFAGLHQLLRPVLAHLDALPQRQRAALGAAFGMDSHATPEPFLIALAALQLLSEAAAVQPLSLIVEDAHWLDRSSANVLTFVARRVESDPIVLLAAIRDGYDNPLLSTGLPQLNLTGLSGQHARELLGAHFPQLPESVRQRVLAEAEGNPLALMELPLALGDVNGETIPVPARWPLTSRLEQAFAARAAELPPATRTVLLVAAADDSGGLAEVMKAAGIAARLAGSGPPTLDDLTPAVVTNLIEVAGQSLRFRHPLVQSAIYQAADIAQRHAAHSALAEVLTDDQDRRVWHRAAGSVAPDPAVSAELAEAAERARRRGSIMTAATAFEQAADFSPDQATRGALLVRAAEAAIELGKTDMLLRLLRDIQARPLTARERAYVTWLGDAFHEGQVGDLGRIRGLVETAKDMTADGNTHLALNLLSTASFRCYWAGLGEPVTAEVLAAADLTGAAPEDPLLLQIQAYTAPLGRGPAVLDQLSRMRVPDDPEALYLLGIAAVLAGDFQASAPLLGGSAARLREQGRLRALAHVLTAQAWTAIMNSDFHVAMPAAEEASQLAAETRQPLWEAGSWTAQATLAALRGEPLAVEELAGRVGEVMLPIGAAEPLSLIQHARGLLAVGEGRHADAYAQLRRIYEPGDPAYNERNGYAAFGDFAEAAAHSGNGEYALELMTRLEPLGGQTAYFGTAMLYANALLSDDQQAEAAFAAALGADLVPWPFTRARLQLAFGEWLRRQRRISEARAQLRAARNAFDTLGTAPWSERARRELRAAGEASRRRTPSTIDRLTAQELQIATLAADGLSNREIGQRLYLSHRTVESHLYRVFPKLRITSRSQLAGVLREGSALRGGTVLREGGPRPE